MSRPKPAYLLAGGRGSRNRSLMRAVFEELPAAKPRVAYVGAASGENREFFEYMTGEVASAADCVVEHAVIATPGADLGRARDILLRSDAVFMSGGDVLAGIAALRDAGMAGLFRGLYLEGKLFFGASAGSIMLGREWVGWADPNDDSSAALFPCLGVVPVVCDTHAEDDGWIELKAALKLGAHGMTGFGIPSGVCLKVLPDGRVASLGGTTVRFRKRGGRVVALSGLAPGRIIDID